jgi:hypothetical protein
MERTSNNLTCNLLINQTTNLYNGPGTNFDRVGQIEALQTLRVDRQTRGDDGFTWYQSTEDDTWIRSDFVEALPIDLRSGGG